MSDFDQTPPGATTITHPEQTVSEFQGESATGAVALNAAAPVEFTINPPAPVEVTFVPNP